MKKYITYDWSTISRIKKSILTCTCSLLIIASCIHEKPDNIDHTDYIHRLRDIVEKKQRFENDEKTIAYYDSAFNTIDKPGTNDLYQKYDFKRNYYYQKKNYPHALIYVDSMIELIKNQAYDAQYKSAYDIVNLFKGDILLAQSKYNEAFSSFFEGKKEAENSSNLLSLSEYNSRLGMVCYKQKKFLEAASYFKQSIAEQADTKNWYYFTKTQELLDNTGMAYMNAGQLDSAMIYYRRTLVFINKNQQILADNPPYIASAKGLVCGNIGDIYFKKKDYKMAEKMYLLGIRLNSSEGQEKGIVQSLQVKLIELYINEKRYNSVRLILIDLRNYLNNYPNTDYEIAWRELKSEYLENIGRKDQSLDYYRSFVSLKDSVENQSNILKAGDIDYRIDRLNNNYTLVQLEAQDKQKMNFLLLGIGVLFLLLTFTYFTWKNYQKSKENVWKLSELNQKLNSKQSELMVAFQSLEKSHEDNRHLIKVVAHDLKYPLVSSLAYLKFMEEKTMLDGEQQNAVNMLKAIGSDSLVLIEELLQDTNQLQSVHVEKVALHTVLQHCVNLLKLKAQEKDQEIELTAEAINILVDAEKIWRVMSNLIVNAIKFSPIGAKISVRLERKNGKVLTLIKDSGIGIPTSYRDSIFTMFTPTQRLGTTGEESFGIGLAVCKNIIETYNGKIWYESVESRGTTFFVELPDL